MRRITTLCFLFSLALGSTATHADHLNHSLATSKRLVEDCKSDVPALRGMCLGYLAAISDGVARHQKIGTSQRTVCVPTEIPLEAYREAFLQFVAKSPKAIEEHSFEAVRSALEAKWPCPR